MEYKHIAACILGIILFVGVAGIVLMSTNTGAGIYTHKLPTRGIQQYRVKQPYQEQTHKIEIPGYSARLPSTPTQQKASKPQMPPGYERFPYRPQPTTEQPGYYAKMPVKGK
ncbi:hypothetical protein KY338_07035 [Candidatus Woesearchaeota archaeon]|nr:hypothetical protein [Candidatus Woesearchaeota archaeon]MBW3005386.1 hypothetical protein [Candidatus Woesearchaeota archaeon]